MRKRRAIAWVAIVVALSGHAGTTLINANEAQSWHDDGSTSSPADAADELQIATAVGSAFGTGLKSSEQHLPCGRTVAAAGWKQGNPRFPARSIRVHLTLQSQSVLLRI